MFAFDCVNVTQLRNTTTAKYLKQVYLEMKLKNNIDILVTKLFIREKEYYMSIGCFENSLVLLKRYNSIAINVQKCFSKILI